MKLLPVADYKFKALTDVSPEFMLSKGIKLLLLDVDNTMAPYEDDAVSPALAAWAERCADSGVRLYIVSNNKGDRPRLFGEALGIPYIKLARKPAKRGLRAAMSDAGFTEEDTAIAGDQIYTDMLATVGWKVRGILVKPVKLTNPLHTLRYIAELPFRWYGARL